MSVAEPIITVYVSRRINLGDYDSVDIFAKWEDVPITAGEGFRDAAMRTTELCVDDLLAKLEAKAKDVRQRERDRKRREGSMEDR